MNNKEINDSLIKFWDTAISLTSEQKEEIKNYKGLDPKELAPSAKLFDAVKVLGSCQKVLDYGCGNAWAGIIANKNGCKDVVAVDLGENIIDSAKFYAELCEANINAFVVDQNWLKSEKEGTYDGLICSNVLDVLPIETTKEIVKELSRISKKNAKIIIGLNFYMAPEIAKQRGMELVEDKYLFVDNVLRLLSLSDDEWKELFLPYFEVDTLEYFAWPGEQKETRRLFVLRKR